MPEVTGFLAGIQEREFIDFEKAEISFSDCAVFLRSTECSFCADAAGSEVAVSAPGLFFGSYPYALVRVYGSGRIDTSVAPWRNDWQLLGQLTNETRIETCELWMVLPAEGEHRIECKGQCTMKAEGFFSHLEISGNILEASLKLQANFLNVSANFGHLWAEFHDSDEISVQIPEGNVYVDFMHPWPAPWHFPYENVISVNLILNLILIEVYQDLKVNDRVGSERSVLWQRPPAWPWRFSALTGYISKPSTLSCGMRCEKLVLFLFLYFMYSGWLLAACNSSIFFNYARASATL